MKHRIKDALRNLTRENHVLVKPYIMIEKGGLSITMSRPDPTTRKMLDCMKENDFKGVMKYMSAVD